MTKEKKKQFSLSLLIRVLLGVIVAVSIGIFANSMMRYNALLDEERELEKIVTNLVELREELNDLMGSAEEVDALLSDYELYQSLLNTGTAEGDTLRELEAKLEELRALIKSSENKDYIVKIAKERLGLYFPDEEIIYNDKNQ